MWNLDPVLISALWFVCFNYCVCVYKYDDEAWLATSGLNVSNQVNACL